MSTSDALELADLLPEPVADFIEPILPRKRGLRAKTGSAKTGLGEILSRSRTFAEKTFALPSRTRKGDVGTALAEIGDSFEGLAQVVVDRLPAPLAELTPLRAPSGAREQAGSWNLASITAALLGLGPLHFLAPQPFDKIIPPSLPGPPRLWTYLSGVAEIGVGTLLVIPRTRRLGGLAAASLFAAVYPANVQMAKDLDGKNAVLEAVAYWRLPLQFPLIYGALKIAITGR
ncbi:MAG: DoxX family protein [Segniliparus sp.]|uniref:DoxX family protein n=1 Tax=Segniliparus sp. TaxID=2804064 RepID=UPI003F2B6677